MRNSATNCAIFAGNLATNCEKFGNRSGRFEVGPNGQFQGACMSNDWGELGHFDDSDFKTDKI